MQIKANYQARSAQLNMSAAICIRALVLLLMSHSAPVPGEPLRISVYCTAGDVQRYLASGEGREQVLRTIQPLHVTRLFLEGRRGDEYVSIAQLSENRDFFAAKGIHCSGGIATVPGAGFGTRQNMELGWLNWESRKTQADVAGFFNENAPAFDELIVDDFFCTGDTSPESTRARGTRPWGGYRRDLLVSLIKPLILKPARTAHQQEQLILKFPQWYDRFQLFGYDPPRMTAQFDQVWVGTEVRDPNTRRMGFVQPTEGYMNFRWLANQAGNKIRGAWFDHIECSAQNFLDQAYMSVLAGARELTLFRLGDLMEGHPGDSLLAAKLSEIVALAKRVDGKARRGVVYYKPPGSDGDENLYLADYLGMIGLPVLPEAKYPEKAAVAFLPVQAAADATLLEKMERHLNRGGTLVLTPALVRAVGQKAARLAGIEVKANSRLIFARGVQISGDPLALDTPIETDGALRAEGCEIQVAAIADDDQPVPFLTRKTVGRGEVLLLNVMTFSDQDFGKAGEWLLAPRQLGLPKIPQSLADAIRSSILSPLNLNLHTPAGVALILFEKDICAYSFRNDQAQIHCQDETLNLPAHQLLWKTKTQKIIGQ